MKFELIDFSGIYFSKILKTSLPAKRSGKFIQVVCYDSDAEYIVLSPKELSVYHANILERFCLQQGAVSGTYNTKRDYFEIHDPSWEVTGGGMWSIDEETKTLSFFGSSQMYGKYDHVGLKKKVLTHSAFTDFAVIVDGC